MLSFIMSCLNHIIVNINVKSHILALFDIADQATLTVSFPRFIQSFTQCLDMLDCMVQYVHTSLLLFRKTISNSVQTVRAMFCAALIFFSFKYPGLLLTASPSYYCIKDLTTQQVTRDY